MKFSGLVFPAPKPPTYSQDRLVGELLYVPKDFNQHPYKYLKKERGNEGPAGTPRASARNLRSGRPGSGRLLREISNENRFEGKRTTLNASSLSHRIAQVAGNAANANDPTK